jgi:hypothetical protein
MSRWFNPGGVDKIYTPTTNIIQRTNSTNVDSIPFNSFGAQMSARTTMRNFTPTWVNRGDPTRGEWLAVVNQSNDVVSSNIYRGRANGQIWDNLGEATFSSWTVDDVTYTGRRMLGLPYWDDGVWYATIQGINRKFDGPTGTTVTKTNPGVCRSTNMVNWTFVEQATRNGARGGTGDGFAINDWISFDGGNNRVYVSDPGSVNGQIVPNDGIISGRSSRINQRVKTGEADQSLGLMLTSDLSTSPFWNTASVPLMTSTYTYNYYDVNTAKSVPLQRNMVMKVHTNPITGTAIAATSMLYLTTDGDYETWNQKAAVYRTTDYSTWTNPFLAPENVSVTVERASTTNKRPYAPPITIAQRRALWGPVDHDGGYMGNNTWVLRRQAGFLLSTDDGVTWINVARDVTNDGLIWTRR